MPGSSLRNAVHRRNHKERSQPVGRQKLGLLEKHKDYVLRAKDHNLKQQRLKRLREIAAMRNKDEFNFGMVRARTVKGVHVQDRGNEALKNDVVALLKTQDAGYVRLQITKEVRRIGKLKERIAVALPAMREEWLDEKDGRKETLQRAGLLRAEKVKGKGKGKATSVAEDDWELALLDGIDDDREQSAASGLIGGMGKKTVWTDDVDEARSYGSKSRSAATAKAVAAAPPAIDEDDEDDDDDLDDEDAFVTESDNDSDEAATAAQRQRRKGEKQLGYLVSELRARQERLDSLREAAEKLGLVKALMTTKGQAARKQSAQKQSLTDAVAAGKVTANGLALPGNESDDDDEEDDEGGRKKQQRKMFKWSKERKR